MYYNVTWSLVTLSYPAVTTTLTHDVSVTMLQHKEGELILMTADLVDYNCRSVAQSLINDRSVVFHKFRTDNLSVAYRGSWITANVLIHNYLCCMRDGTDVLIIDTCRGQLVSSL